MGVIDRCMGPCPTVDPTKQKTPQPTQDQNGWGNPKPSKQPKNPRPTKAKRTKAPKTPKPAKTPRPTKYKAPKTSRPTSKRDTRPPKKTERPTSTYLRETTTYLRGEPETTTYLRSEPKPSRDQSEMIAVEMNGSYAQTMTGYSAQTEIIGLLSIATVLAICGYSLCNQRKEDQYEEIADVSV